MEDTTNNKKIIEEIITSFIDIIGYAIDVAVTYDDQEDIYKVEMTGENLGGLIGYHGKNIQSIELILNLMTSKFLNMSKRYLIIDINGYRQARIAAIKGYVENAINKVKKTSKPYSLYPMSSYERLFVHKIIQEHEELESLSSGVEPNRAVTIKIKGE